MYLTLAELKTRLWITGNSQDTYLGILLDDSRGVIVWAGLDYESKERTKLIPSYKIINDLYLDCPNVTAISSINGVTYSGAKDTDWLVLDPMGAVVHFINLNTSNYLDGNYLKIVYTAGYASNAVPNDLKLLQFYLVLGLQLENRSMSSAFTGATSSWSPSGIKQIAMWPRTITYSDSAMLGYWSGAMDMYQNLDKKTKSIINRYRLHTL